MTDKSPARKLSFPRKPLAVGAAPGFPSRQDLVASLLRDQILRSELAAGSRLDIDEIAAAHGVSRTPVRDALKQLETEGLVQVFPYRGVEVTTLTAADLSELFGIRIALERLCVSRSVEVATEEDLQAMRRTLQRMDRLKKRDAGWTDLNTEFHNAVYASARWPRLAELIRTQRNNVERYVRARADGLGTERQQAQHWALVDAITKRDTARAQDTITAHYQETLVAMTEPPTAPKRRTGRRA